MSRQIVLDTETTGIHVSQGHRIIEVGCVELVNRRVTDRQYHCYLNPQRDVDAGAVEVHGLTTEFLQDKPLFAEVATEFMDYIRGAELIIHNAPFDVGFINQELQGTGKDWQPLTEYCRIVDTLVMARKLHPGMRNNLDALCKRYGVDNTKRDYHGALLDAHLLAQVYLAMTEGQRSLFDEMDRSSQALIQKTTPKINEQRRRIILRATAEEEALHEEYLQKIVKPGKCLWSDRRDG